MAPNETSKSTGLQQAANVVLIVFIACFKTVTRSKCHHYTQKILDNLQKHSLIS